MKQEMKYQIRRLIAAIILVGLLLVFTTSVLVKTDALGKLLDAEFQRQDKVLENHFAVHGVER